MSVLFMLYWLVAGVVGFLMFFSGMGVLFTNVTLMLCGGRQNIEPIGHLKYKDRWLLEHFGKEGRKRWYRNEEVVEEYLTWFNASRECERFRNKKSFSAILCRMGERHARRKMEKRERREGGHVYQKVRRDVGGGSIGMVLDRVRLKDPVWKYNGEQPPWGIDGRNYYEHHNSPFIYYGGDAISARTGKVCLAHGEPRGSDWLAAGFWDPFMRDDGVVIDPIAILYDNAKKEWWKGGVPDRILDDDEFYRRVVLEVRDDWKNTKGPSNCSFGERGMQVNKQLSNLLSERFGIR